MNTLPPISTAPTPPANASNTVANTAANTGLNDNEAASDSAELASSENGFSAMLAKKLRSDSKNKNTSDQPQDAAALLMADANAANTFIPDAAQTLQLDPGLMKLVANNTLNTGAELKPGADEAALLANGSALVEKNLGKNKLKDLSSRDASLALNAKTKEVLTETSQVQQSKTGTPNTAANTALNANAAELKIDAKADSKADFGAALVLAAKASEAVSKTTTALDINTLVNPNPAANTGFANSTNSLSAAPSVSAVITTPLTSPGWGNELVQQVKQFALDGIGVAEIRLNPQELGPIRVEIALDNKQAAIHFSAQHADTRDALNQNFARLRDSLADAGLNLQNATTGSFSDNQAFSFMQQQRERNAPSANYAGANFDNAPENSLPGISNSASVSTAARSRSGVDLFA